MPNGLAHNNVSISPVTVADPIRVGTVARPLVVQGNPIAVATAQYAGGSTGIQINFTMGVDVTAASLQLWRAQSLDYSRATLVQTWTGPFKALQKFSFADSDQIALSSSVNYYWATIVYEVAPNYTAKTYGPQAVFVNAGLQAQEQIQAFSVSETSLGGGLVRIGVSFQKPAAPDFGSIQVFGSGYLGITSQQLLAQSSIDPFGFTMEQTGETVRFQANSVNIQGTPFPGGPTQTLTLNGTNTVPCVVYNAIAVSISNANQVTFPAGPETNITAYQLWRSALGGSFGTASLIESIAPGQQASYTILDNIASPQSYQYYIVAVNAAGSSAASPAIVPGASYASGSQGTGAAATPLLVANGANKSIVLATITNQGTNYYQIPLATFSGSSLGQNAAGYCTVDGSGHVNAIILTSGGLYAGTDTPSVSIHY